jgi:hypothetical protein
MLTSSEAKWFVLRADQQFGPYTYPQMINLLQQSQIFDFDFAWANPMDNWMRIAEIAEFHPQHLALVVKEDKGEVFYRRMHKRAKHQQPLYVINESDYFSANTISISEGGALIVCKSPFFLPGDKIKLHFKNTSGDSFNVEAEVVSKKYTNEKIFVNSGLQYVVRFLQLHDLAKQTIRSWVNNSSTTEEADVRSSQVYR